MKINLNFSPEIFNTKFAEVWHSEERYLHLWGGASSGKSHDAPTKILIRMLEETHSEVKHRFLATRKVKDKIKHSVFDQFKERIQKMNLNYLFKITESEMKILCKNGNEILFAGLDDPNKLESFEGVTGIYNEEAIQMSRKDFMILDKTMRSSAPFTKQMIFCYNPIDWNSFLKTEPAHPPCRASGPLLLQRSFS